MMDYQRRQTPGESTDSLDFFREVHSGHSRSRIMLVDASTQTETPEEVTVVEDDGYLSGFKLFAVVGSATLVVFMILLDVSIISTAVPLITSDFHALDDVGWYAASYQLASASLQPMTGKLYTHFSVKWTFIMFVSVFMGGSLVCAIASSSVMFIGGRTIAGLGGSGLINGGLTVISGSVAPERRALFISLMMGFGQLGLISGPLIGGSLTQYLSWRWCFYINLPIGGLSLIFLTLIQIPDLMHKPPFSLARVREVIPELDLIGFGLFVPAAVMFLLALQFGGNEYPWNSATIIGLFYGAVVVTVIFIFWEYRMGDRAMIPGSILKHRIAVCSAFQGMFLAGTVFVASYYFPIYFQAVKGVGPTLSGVYLLPSIASQLVVVIISGWAITKMGYYLPWPVAAGAISGVGNLLVSTFSPSTPVSQWVGYQIILGAGRGAGMQMAMIAIQNNVQGRQIPVAIAFQIFCQNMLGSVLLTVASVIFTQSLDSQLAQYAPSVTAADASAAGGSADAVRALLPEGSPELPGLLTAYSNSVDRVFYMLVILSLLSFITAWGMGWKDTRKKKEGPGEKDGH
ncbi:efflux pump protein [Xylariales sp. PMI_506]|nr:efflux pump protein [Xylariales sp. PMI_506]